MPDVGVQARRPLSCRDEGLTTALWVEVDAHRVALTQAIRDVPPAFAAVIAGVDAAARYRDHVAGLQGSGRTVCSREAFQFYLTPIVELELPSALHKGLQ